MQSMEAEAEVVVLLPLHQLLEEDLYTVVVAAGLVGIIHLHLETSLDQQVDRLMRIQQPVVEQLELTEPLLPLEPQVLTVTQLEEEPEVVAGARRLRPQLVEVTVASADVEAVVEAVAASA